MIYQLPNKFLSSVLVTFQSSPQRSRLTFPNRSLIIGIPLLKLEPAMVLMVKLVSSELGFSRPPSPVFPCHAGLSYHSIWCHPLLCSTSHGNECELINSALSQASQIRVNLSKLITITLPTFVLTKGITVPELCSILQCCSAFHSHTGTFWRLKKGTCSSFEKPCISRI